MAHSSKNISLSEYLSDVCGGNILVPQFQREFVWSKTQMVKLAASLLKGYPIGSFLLMQNTGEYACRLIDGFEEDDDIQQNSEFRQENHQNGLLILDGQQRTTTAYQIFYGKGKYKFYFDYKQFVEDIKDELNSSLTDTIEDKIEEWLIALPNDKAINNPDEQRAKGFFPLDIILNNNNTQDYSQWLDTYSTSNSLGSNRQLDMDKFNMLSKCKSVFIRNFIESITSYQASEIIIDKNTSPNIVCTIFETINSTGQKLTIFDLLNAKCFPSGFMLRNELESAFDANDAFYDFDPDKESLIGNSVIKVIGLFCRKSCKKSDLLSLKAEEIKEFWECAINNTVNALIYIKVNYGVLGLQYFPYKDILPVVSVVINDSKFKSNEQENTIRLNKWYWNSVISGYFDNAADSKIIKSIKELLGDEKNKGWFDDQSLLPEIVKNSEFTNFDYLDNLASVQSAQYKAILNLLTLNGIEDFSPSRVRISDLKENQLNDHHIYPKKFLSLHKIKGSKMNTILNRTLITKESNLKIKDRPPFDYFVAENIVKNDFTSQELIRHCIPKEHILCDFSEQKFNEFKNARKKLLIELIKNRI